MCDKSDLTCREFLDALFEQIQPYADSPEEFAEGWKGITTELDEQVKKLEHVTSKRNKLVRKLLILMRTQLVQSTLLDDPHLQKSQGCSILKDYAYLDRPNKPVWYGHKCDGIDWNTKDMDEAERSDLAKLEKKREKLAESRPEPFDFKGSENKGWEYCSCLDHAVSNLICKVWGFSGYRKGLKSDDPETKFNVAFWGDASMYLAVLLCFGDNILDDQKFLREIGANLVEADTPQDKLLKVLSVPGIRAELWGRIQGHIKEDDSKSPDQP